MGRAPCPRVIVCMCSALHSRVRVPMDMASHPTMIVHMVRVLGIRVRVPMHRVL